MMREALEQYADTEIYDSWKGTMAIEDDEGETAREALKG
jgi:hypothetical protein